MKFRCLPDDPTVLTLDVYTPSYRYVQVENEDFMRIYGLTVFVDESIMKESLDTYFELCNGIKHKIIVDPTLEVGMTSGARKMLKREVPKMTTSLALMTNNPFTQMTANLFLKTRNDGFNVRLFRDYDKAMDWIKNQ